MQTDLKRVALVVEALNSQKTPALNSYDFARILFQQGLFIESQSAKKDFDSILEIILKLHLLSPTGLNNSFFIFGRTSATAAEVICSIDPFAYLSHLSAMEHHGLTDRFSNVLYMTRPTSTAWKQDAEKQMQKDLDEKLDQYITLKLPTLKRQKLEKIGKTLIHFEEKSQMGAFRHVPDTSLRVATIGRVFLDMIREPHLCGGIQHVIDIYQKEASRYLQFIIDEINQHGKPIDKVRAGFLLDEICGLQSPALVPWETFAQRGGSRKLDLSGEYAPHHSERWKLSINVPALLANT